MSVSAPSSTLREFIDKLLLLDRSLQLPGLGPDEHGFLEKLLITADVAPVLLAYVDGAERYRFCNQAYERWFGEKREHILGRSMREILGEAAYELVRGDIQAALSGRWVRFERVVPYRIGGSRMVRADYVPHVLPDGRVAGFVGMVEDITELRRGEEAARMAEALRESEDRLRLALLSAQLGIWEFNPLTGQRTWDDRCRELFGLPSGGESVSQEAFLACLHPEDRARADAEMKAALEPEGGGRYQVEFRTVDARGRVVRWLSSHGQVYFDARRQPVRCVGTARDVTVSRRALLRMERLYALSSALSQALLPEEVAQVVVREGRVALEALSASLALVSADGTMFELRAAYGFPEGVLDERWRCFPIDTPVMFREAVRTGRPVLYGNLAAFLRDYPELADSPALVGQAFVALPLRVEARIIGAFGFSFEHEWEFTPEELRLMEALGHQCAMAIERARLYAAERQARAEAERLRDRLSAESTLLEAVLQQLPVSVVIAEPGGRIVRGSAAVETIWSQPYVASGSISEYAAYKGFHADGRPYAPEEWPLSRSLLHGETVVREPVTVVLPDGSLRKVDVSATLVRDAEGRTVAGVAVSTDVTQHHQLQEALRREGEVREKLLGIVSHDLRNPLQAMSTASHLLLTSSEPLTPLQRKWVTRVRTSVQRMDRLIQDLLEFVRIRQGETLPIQRQAVCLEEVCRTIVDELQAAHPHRQFLLEAHGDTLGEWDPERLMQLVGNLLANALTHGSEGTPIQVRIDGEGAQVVLEVVNQGHPIPPELLPRIFEPFTRASDGGNALKGVGLGLFIVHEIVAAHRGHIDVHSSAETGTVFQVSLPRA
ncbi:PAS domain-containing sensor histidine kinase [Archangium lansingense]|uniref:histidine kinase n=1 Tax=Archangium lansingense TaxID=2995310 RepID=A0ABT4AA87_9BACT|nr:PAS domain S-box protein [Archangium lansinium]MCY1078571.1 PAS domain S-box protein [Archangium lansinium]